VPERNVAYFSGHAFLNDTGKKRMQNILYNLNSVEESYGESTLTGVIQIHERVADIAMYIDLKSAYLNDYEKEETKDRLNKLIDLNRKIRTELEKQEEDLMTAASKLMPLVNR
jgi:hypothetical protein